MAQKVQTFLIDDLDGSDAESTVSFGLDGTQYEIDLSAGHARELRTTVARYTGAGRKAAGTTRRAGHGGRKRPASGVSNAAVRAWAQAKGLAVKERGRISADVIARFQAAAGR